MKKTLNHDIIKRSIKNGRSMELGSYIFSGVILLAFVSFLCFYKRSSIEGIVLIGLALAFFIVGIVHRHQESSAIEKAMGTKEFKLLWCTVDNKRIKEDYDPDGPNKQNYLLHFNAGTYGDYEIAVDEGTYIFADSNTAAWLLLVQKKGTYFLAEFYLCEDYELAEDLLEFVEDVKPND